MICGKLKAIRKQYSSLKGVVRISKHVPTLLFFFLFTFKNKAYEKCSLTRETIPELWLLMNWFLINKRFAS